MIGTRSRKVGEGRNQEKVKAILGDASLSLAAIFLVPSLLKAEQGRAMGRPVYLL
jgi:hypothetical protein